MSDSTPIEWTHIPGYAGATWNPLAGCSITSPGCRNCYAMRMAARLEAMGQEKYAGTTKKAGGKTLWTGRINLDEKSLDIPLKTKKPTAYFVNSMSDLFHENVPDEFIDKVFAVMALSPQHIFQVLTKRPERMNSYFAEKWQPAPLRPVDETAPRECTEDRQDRILSQTTEVLLGSIGDEDRFWTAEGQNIAYANPAWPLPNVWIGTSVEDQTRANERIPHLLKTPAAVWFLLCEPLLSDLELTQLKCGHLFDCEGATYYDALRGYSFWGSGDFGVHGPAINWVIVGGESGPGARPMHPDWARSIRDQCQAAGVPYFFKQWGAFGYATIEDDPDFAGGKAFNDHVHGGRLAAIISMRSKKAFESAASRPLEPGDETVRFLMIDEQTVAIRGGKKSTGRTLDGRTWDEFPKAVTT